VSHLKIAGIKMFSFFYDQGDPTSEDEGKFLSEEELLAWHRNMQRQYPQVFTEDDKLFGELGGQHPLGTKLMTWFDNDPNKPIRLEVRGSRWKIELGDCSPMYVVKRQDDGELSQIYLTSAHEAGGWKVGWNLKHPGSN
jgi:hypothetical protein